MCIRDRYWRPWQWSQERKLERVRRFKCRKSNNNVQQVRYKRRNFWTTRNYDSSNDRLYIRWGSNRIANENGSRVVCTFDAFAEYCEEAEKNGIEHYELYHWTKSTIENPEKKSKHLKSFAFYEGDNQVYNKELAVSIKQNLENLDSGNDIIEINLIDSNPANNPQPPKQST